MAVSKTVNLPANATVEDVDKVFYSAYELGCKGITVYRDGIRQAQIVTAGGNRRLSLNHWLTPRPRSYRTRGDTFKLRTGCGTFLLPSTRTIRVFVRYLPISEKQEAVLHKQRRHAELFSIGLRAGVEPEELIEQLKNIRCPSMLARRKNDKDITKLSCADAIASAME